MSRIVLFSLAVLASATLSAAVPLSVANHNNIKNNYAVNRSFTIAEDGTTFLKDGAPYRVLSGSFHYFRAPAALWEERFRTLKASGLNAVATYVAWNYHCPDEEDECDFTGDKDLVYWVQLAQKYELDVLLRPGPFICAEWDYGGMPAWMMRDNIYQEVRSVDPVYMGRVRRWFAKLFPLIAPYAYHRGGNIIMTQIENEYGTIGSDKNYLEAMRQLVVSYMGEEMLLYSADPAQWNAMKGSAAPGIFQAANFWQWPTSGDVKQAWEIQASMMGKVSRQGPPMNAEFYPGWITYWGDKVIDRRPVDWLTNMTRSIMGTSSSHSNLNFYVFFGGTNFGFWARRDCVTSYDYGAPMNESGHAIPHYYALQKVFGDLNFPPAPGAVPLPPPLRNFGSVTWDAVAPLFGPGAGDNLRQIAQGQQSIPLRGVKAPLTMEQLNQSYGYIAYTVTLGSNATAIDTLEVYPHDYAMIYFDGVYQGNMIRDKTDGKRQFPQHPMVKEVTIVVENMGRISWFVAKGTHAKGLLKPIVINGNPQQDYDVWRLPMKETNIANLQWTSAMKQQDQPHQQGTFFRGYLKVSTPVQQPLQDTMLDLRGFGKGIVFVNGFNLGRYWSSRGPQYSYYCPRNLLRFNGINEVIIFEQESVFKSGMPPTLTFSNENYNSQMNQ